MMRPLFSKNRGRFVGHRLNRAHEAYILRHHRGQYGGDFFLMVWICELLFLRRI